VLPAPTAPATCVRCLFRLHHTILSQGPGKNLHGLHEAYVVLVFCAVAQVRTTIVEFLESKGLFRGTRPNPMVLGLCSRSGDVIEPLMRPQWCVWLLRKVLLSNLFEP